MDIADQFPLYPEQADPGLISFLSSSKEFVDLASSKNEKTPKRSEFYNHQLAGLRFLREYDYLVLTDEPGTGKTGKIQAYTEWARQELKRDPYAAITGALILVPGKNTRLEFIRQLIYKSNAGEYERLMKGQSTSKAMTKILADQGFYKIFHYRKFSNYLSTKTNEEIAALFSNHLIFMDEIHTLHIDLEPYKAITQYAEMSMNQTGNGNIALPQTIPAILSKVIKKVVTTPTNVNIYYQLVRLKSVVTGCKFVGASATLMAKEITDMIPLVDLFRPPEIPRLPDTLNYDELYRKSSMYYFQDLELYISTLFPYRQDSFATINRLPDSNEFKISMKKALFFMLREVNENIRSIDIDNILSSQEGGDKGILQNISSKIVSPHQLKPDPPVDTRNRDRVAAINAVLTQVNSTFRVNVGSKVLDVGCNNGAFLKTLKQSYPSLDLYGTDILPAVNTEGKFTYRQLDADSQRYPFYDDFFDLIILNVTLHHILSAKNIGSIKRILKRGGLIILREHNIRTKEEASFVDVIHALYEVIDERMSVEEFLRSYNANYLSEAQIDQIFLSPSAISFVANATKEEQKEPYFEKLFSADVNFYRNVPVGNSSTDTKNPQRLYYVAYYKIRNYDITDYALKVLSPYLSGYFTYVKSLETKARQRVISNVVSADLVNEMTITNPLTKDKQRIDAYAMEIVVPEQIEAMEILAQGEGGSDKFNRNKSEVGAFLFPDGTYDSQAFDRFFILPSLEGRKKDENDSYFTIKPQYINSFITQFRKFYSPEGEPLSKVTIAAHLAATTSLASFNPAFSAKKGCCFIFSDSIRGSNGVYVVSECLRLLYGYVPYLGKESAFENTLSSAGESRKRKINIPKANRYAVITGDVSEMRVTNILDLMNSPENVFGEYIQCIIVTEAAEQSISFSHVVRSVIITTQATQAQFKQITTRYIRATSHDELLAQLRINTITVDLYPLVSYLFLENGELITPDIRQLKSARMFSFYTSMHDRTIKRISINCILDYQRNEVDISYQDTATCDYTACQYDCQCLKCKRTNSPLTSDSMILTSLTSNEVPNYGVLTSIQIGRAHV